MTTKNQVDKLTFDTEDGELKIEFTNMPEEVLNDYIGSLQDNGWVLTTHYSELKSERSWYDRYFWAIVIGFWTGSLVQIIFNFVTRG